MLPIFALRLTARRVPTAFALTRATGSSSKWVPNTLTRSFMASVLRAEPTKATSAATTKKPAAKKAAEKKPVKAKAKVAKKKPAKKPTKPKTPIVPKGTKIPKLGPTSYLYFSSRIYKSDVKVSKENIGDVSKACAAAWKALSEAERKKIGDEAAALRVKASAERQAYINSLDPAVLKEINRRRVKSGKFRVHKKNPSDRPVNGYVRFVAERNARKGVSGQVFLKESGEAWKALTDEQRKARVYNDAYYAEVEERKAKEAA